MVQRSKHHNPLSGGVQADEVGDGGGAALATNFGHHGTTMVEVKPCKVSNLTFAVGYMRAAVKGELTHHEKAEARLIGEDTVRGIKIRDARIFLRNHFRNGIFRQQ